MGVRSILSPRQIFRYDSRLLNQSCREHSEKRQKRGDCDCSLFFVRLKDQDIDFREEDVMKEKSKGVKESKKEPQMSLKEKRKLKKEKKNR